MLESCGEVHGSSWKVLGFRGEKTDTSGIYLGSQGNVCELLGDAWVLWVDACVSWGCMCGVTEKNGVPMGRFRMHQGFALLSKKMLCSSRRMLKISGAMLLLPGEMLGWKMGCLAPAMKGLFFPMDVLVYPREVPGYTQGMPGLSRKVFVLPGSCSQRVLNGDSWLPQEDGWNLKGSPWLPQANCRVLQVGS